MYVELAKLNIPDFQFKFDNKEGALRIFDTYRNKWIVLTDEEWVRQNFARYLNETLGYPKSRTKIEHNLKYGMLNKRCDIIVYDKAGHPFIVAECKSHLVKLSQSTINQLSTYNSLLGSKYLCITNGLKHYYYNFNLISNKYESTEALKKFNED